MYYKDLNRDQADELISIAKAFNCVDRSVYESYLSFLSARGDTKAVAQGIHKMTNDHFPADERTYAYLLKAHLQSSNTQDALVKQVVATMRSMGLVTNYTYHILIRFYCSIGVLSRAMEFYREMLARGIVPPEKTYHVLLTAHSKTPAGCKGMFDEMKKHVAPTPATYELLATLFKEQGDAATCTRLRDGMAKKKLMPTAKTYAVWLDVFGQVQDWPTCKELWEEMHAKGVPRTQETFLAMLNHYMASGDSDTIIKVFQELKDAKIVPELFVYNSLLDIYANAGDAFKCHSLFVEMQKRGNEPSVETYDKMIRVYTKTQDLTNAMRFFDQMRRDKIVPNKSTHMTLLRAYARTYDARAVKKIISLMRLDGVNPDVACYNILLSEATGKEAASWCRKWFDEMKDEGIDPDETTYKTLLEKYGKLGEVQGCLEVYEEVKQRREEKKTVEFTLNTALSICSAKGNMAACSKILDDAKSARVPLAAATYNKLIAGFAKVGDLLSCQKLEEEMKGKGMGMDDDAREAIRTHCKGGSLYSTLLSEMAMEEEEEGEKT